MQDGPEFHGGFPQGTPGFQGGFPSQGGPGFPGQGGPGFQGGFPMQGRTGFQDGLPEQDPPELPDELVAQGRPGFPGGGFPGPGGPGFPGGGFPGPGGQQAPTSPPPSFTPQYPSVQAFAVDPGAIRGCLFRNTFIWTSRRRGFWFYPTFVGRTSVAGYRWSSSGRRWMFTGIDLNRIEQFTCF
ncbi:hypothetical protein MHZ92_15015 [Sporosarcina sp. ACRSL]|nr:hypothetical protein [Sporosarcina sp. ACRSL]MCG7345446.1 hypothetical protein [Sporosarcina sp. ACRSL]